MRRHGQKLNDRNQAEFLMKGVGHDADKKMDLRWLLSGMSDIVGMVEWNKWMPFDGCRA